MIAADTSIFISYLQGDRTKATDIIDQALDDSMLMLPPIVLTELLSDHKLDKRTHTLLCELPTLKVLDGYFERAGKNRALILAKKLKARLADTLIAQSCIDYKIPLLTSDNDFRHFQKYCGLRLMPIK